MSTSHAIKRCILFEPIKNTLAGHETLNNYAPITYVFNDTREIMGMSEDMLSERICARLKEIRFDPHTDVVVLAGSMNAVAQLVAVAVNMFGSVGGLKYMKRTESFAPIELG